MSNPSESLARIESKFDDFCQGIKNCRMLNSYDAATYEDAYARLARVRDRFKHEKKSLKRSECEALSKVFDEDVFTKGMMNIRQVGEHVTRDDLVIYTTANAPIKLDVGSSALAVFSGPVVILDDVNGNPIRYDHLEHLDEMEKRISAAIRKAKN